MKANRPIDAMVAEHVMETEKYWSIRWGGSGYGDFPTYDEAVIQSKKLLGGRQATIAPYWDEPKYSTDIYSAWLVVEKLAGEQGPYSVVMNNNDGDWVVHFWNGDRHDLYANADTAPMAICLAALKAVGVEIEEMEGKP